MQEALSIAWEWAVSAWWAVGNIVMAGFGFLMLGGLIERPLSWALGLFGYRLAPAGKISTWCLNAFFGIAGIFFLVTFSGMCLILAGYMALFVGFAVYAALQALF